VGRCALTTYLSVNSCVYSDIAAWSVAFTEFEDMEGVNERNGTFNVGEFNDSWRILFILRA